MSGDPDVEGDEGAKMNSCNIATSSAPTWTMTWTCVALEQVEQAPVSARGAGSHVSVGWLSRFGLRLWSCEKSGHALRMYTARGWFVAFTPLRVSSNVAPVGVN